MGGGGEEEEGALLTLAGPRTATKGALPRTFFLLSWALVCGSTRGEIRSGKTAKKGKVAQFRHLLNFVLDGVQYRGKLL